MLVAGIPTSEYGQINGLVMNGSTIYWWFELIASLICSSRRGEVPLEVWFELLQMLSECYFILGGHGEVLLSIMYTT